MTRRDAFMLQIRVAVVVVLLILYVTYSTPKASKLCDERHGGKRGVTY